MTVAVESFHNFERNGCGSKGVGEVSQGIVLTELHPNRPDSMGATALSILDLVHSYS